MVFNNTRRKQKSSSHLMETWQQQQSCSWRGDGDLLTCTCTFCPDREWGWGAMVECHPNPSVTAGCGAFPGFSLAGRRYVKITVCIYQLPPNPAMGRRPWAAFQHACLASSHQNSLRNCDLAGGGRCSRRGTGRYRHSIG